MRCDPTFLVVALLALASCDRGANVAPSAQPSVELASRDDAVANPIEVLPAAQREPALENAKKRWESLTVEERASALTRYEEFARLGSAERTELVERARRMRETMQRVQSELPLPVRERLRQLEPDKRREAMREIVTDEARARGQEIRAKLPDAWLDRLESARPEERPAILAQFRERHLKRIADFAIEHLGASVGLDDAERRRLGALSMPERVQAVLDLRKRALEKDASENGLPPGMTAEDWKELVRLEPEAFFARMQDYRRKRVASEPPDADASNPPTNPVDPSALTPQRREGLQRLLRAVQQQAEDVIELVDLPKEERRTRLFELRRARCVEILRAYRLVPPDKLGELETMGEKRLHEVLRHVLQPLRRSESWPARGDVKPEPDTTPPKSGAREPRIVPGLRDGGRC
ncbi:MAG: hypothetical protein HZA53_00420 [Planctomycetes bacterium]|nr:hypothetical protein [Planctomycetota bacterium]